MLFSPRIAVSVVLTFLTAASSAEAQTYSFTCPDGTFHTYRRFEQTKYYFVVSIDGGPPLSDVSLSWAKQYACLNHQAPTQQKQKKRGGFGSLFGALVGGSTGSELGDAIMGGLQQLADYAAEREATAAAEEAARAAEEAARAQYEGTYSDPARDLTAPSNSMRQCNAQVAYMLEYDNPNVDIMEYTCVPYLIDANGNSSRAPGAKTLGPFRMRNGSDGYADLGGSQEFCSSHDYSLDCADAPPSVSADDAVANPPDLTGRSGPDFALDPVPAVSSSVPATALAAPLPPRAVIPRPAASPTNLAFAFSPAAPTPNSDTRLDFKMTEGSASAAPASQTDLAFKFTTTPTQPVAPTPRVAAGTATQTAAPATLSTDRSNSSGLPPMIGASGGTAYSVDTGKVVNAPAVNPQTATAYSVDTGKVVAAPPLPIARPTSTPAGFPQGGSGYSVDAGKVVAAPPGSPNGAYSTDTGKIVTAPSGSPNGAYSVDTGQVVAPPGAPNGVYSTDVGRIVTAPEAGGTYSTDTGRLVALPPVPSEVAYSTETGQNVVPPPRETLAVPGPAGQPIQIDRGGFAIDTGRVVNVPPTTPGGTPVSGIGATGTGAEGTVTAFDGTYNATITLTSPPDVRPALATPRSFVFSVVNGTPQANEVLGTVRANGFLADGRAQIRLKVGPSATLVVPLVGSFRGGTFTVGGATPCGNGLCVVLITGMKVR